MRYPDRCSCCINKINIGAPAGIIERTWCGHSSKIIAGATGCAIKIERGRSYCIAASVHCPACGVWIGIRALSKCVMETREQNQKEDRTQLMK
jgi:hypothetical protein